MKNILTNPIKSVIFLNEKYSGENRRLKITKKRMKLKFQKELRIVLKVYQEIDRGGVNLKTLKQNFKLQFKIGLIGPKFINNELYPE